MPIRLTEENGGKILSIKVNTILDVEDFEKFSVELLRLLREHGKIRVLFQLNDFFGWDFSGYRQSSDIDLKQLNHIEKVAMVGEMTWQQGVTVLCKPLTSATVRYFDGDADEKVSDARRWLNEG